MQMLEKNLSHRPEKKELIDRNILKGVCCQCASVFAGRGLRPTRCPVDDSVAPALQAAKEKLQRSQLEVSRRVCAVGAASS